MIIDDDPNTSVCPICGGGNNCALTVSSDSGEPCWCVSMKIPDEVLQQIPMEARNKSCICRECIERSAERQTPLHLFL